MDVVAEALLGDRAVPPELDRLDERAGDSRKVGGGVAVAVVRRGRFDAVADAVHAAGDRRREGVVRVGVGARDPALDAHALTVADDAEAERAVVDRPRDRRRRPAAGQEAPVAVDRRGEQQRELLRRRDQPAEVPAERLAHVVRGRRPRHQRRRAVLVPQARVDVEARPGVVVVRLGHERRRLAVLVGDLLDRVLEDEVDVGHLDRGLVREVDLVLALAGLALGELDREPGAL